MHHKRMSKVECLECGKFVPMDELAGSICGRDVCEGCEDRHNYDCPLCHRELVESQRADDVREDR